jgi:hypothetical protein
MKGSKIEDRANSSSHEKGRGEVEMFHVERNQTVTEPGTRKRKAQTIKDAAVANRTRTTVNQAIRLLKSKITASIRVSGAKGHATMEKRAANTQMPPTRGIRSTSSHPMPDKSHKRADIIKRPWLIQESFSSALGSLRISKRSPEDRRGTSGQGILEPLMFSNEH